MAKSEMWSQCEFEKRPTNSKDETAVERTVAYIPAWAAEVGNMVQLLTLDGEFWRVVSVSDIPIDVRALRDAERAYKGFQGSTKGGGIDK